jgi:hypothetical protein
MVEFIMAVDPGGTTGIATFNYRTRLWRTYQLPYKPIDLYECFAHLIDSYSEEQDNPWQGAITVIGERFDYRPVGKYNFGGSRAIPKVDLTPRNVLGILELACAYAGIEIHWQAPADVNGDDGKKTGDPKVFWTDDKVKQLQLYKAGHVHEMDAVKHILYYRSFTLGETKLFEDLRPTKMSGYEVMV